MLAEVEQRLAERASRLRLVAGAIEFAALQANPPANRQPAGYVVPLAAAAEANPFVNAVRQRITQEFGIALALGNLRDARGGRAARELETVIADVRDALVGWNPGADHDPTEFLRGDLLEVRDGVVWWLERFRSRFIYSGME